MATKNIVPNADTEGQLGTSTKGWGKIFLGGAAANIDVNNVSGTNTAGKSLTLISGASTGSGAGGSIIFQTAAAGGSGTSVNSHATVLTLDSAKLATFTGGLDIAGAVDIAGDLTLSAGADGALNFSAASSIKILDNSATSLVIEEADTAYMTFVTTNSSEAIKFDKALDINAAVQLDSTLTVGVNDTGYDVKFFGATSGKSLLWDESADSLIVTGTTDLIGTTNLDIVDIDGAVNIGAEVTLADANKIIFNDASQFIHASSDAILNLGGGDEIDITSPTIDVNASTSVLVTTPDFKIDSSGSDDPLLTLKTTHTNKNNSSVLKFLKDAANIENGEIIGKIEFYADDDGANETLYSKIQAETSVTTNGQEGGKLSLMVASNDAEMITGLLLQDGNAEDEIDVTIGSGTSSVTTIAGGVAIAGASSLPVSNAKNGAGIQIPTNKQLGFGNGASGRPDFGFAVDGTSGDAKLEIFCGVGDDAVDAFFNTSGLFKTAALQVADAGAIGCVSDADLLTLSSGQVILNGNAGQGVLQLATSKAAGSLIATQSIGEINFRHNHAATAATVTSARIIGAAAENTVSGQDNHGGQLEFYTAANGNNETSPVKRLTIGSDGAITIPDGQSLSLTNNFSIDGNGRILAGGFDTDAAEGVYLKNIRDVNNNNFISFRKARGAGGGGINGGGALTGGDWIGQIEAEGTYATDTFGSAGRIVIKSTNTVNATNGVPGLISFQTNPSSSTTIREVMLINANGQIDGDFNDTSDEALKENIADSTKGISIVKQLKSRSFDWKEPSASNNNIGFVAQEVETVLPEVVFGENYAVDDDGNKISSKTINVTGIVSVLTKAMQEQQVIIEDLKSRIETLEG